MSDDPMEQAITGYWGERCADTDPECPCCQAWLAYDRQADEIVRLREENERLKQAAVAFESRCNQHRLFAEAAGAERDRLRDALKGTAASLVAALSILNRAKEANVAPNYAVASDKMFAQMLRDYEASLDLARAALGDKP